MDAEKCLSGTNLWCSIPLHHLESRSLHKGTFPFRANGSRLTCGKGMFDFTAKLRGEPVMRDDLFWQVERRDRKAREERYKREG